MAEEKSRVSKRHLKMMLEFFEKYDMCPYEAKKQLEASYKISSGQHYSSGVLDYGNYSWAIDTLKELIARKEKETSRVQRVHVRGLNRRYF